MDRIRLILAERRLEIAVLAVWAAAVVFVTLHHEPWRDEADSWLLARDASLPEVFALMPYAGTPALWYLLLFPFAKAGLPFVTQSIVNVAVMLGAAAVVLFRAPLPRPLRVLTVFSYFVVYEYAVIARSYGLTVLLLVGAAALHPSRLQRPLRYAAVLALLMQANSHSLALGGLLMLAFLVAAAIERAWTRGVVTAVVLMVLSAGLAIAQLRPPPDGNLARTARPPQFQLAGEAVGSAFFPLVPAPAAVAAGALLLLVLTLHLRRSPEALAFLWLGVTGLLVLFVFVWSGGLRHFGLIFLVATIALWIGGKAPAGIFAVVWTAMLAWSVAAGVAVAARDVVAPFSGAKETAQYLRESRLTGKTLAGHPPEHAAAVLPYLPRKQAWFAGIGEFGSYQKWDARFERAHHVTYPEAVARVRRRFAGEDYLLLLNVEMPEPEREGFRLLFRNREVPFAHPDERYWLYAPVR